MATRNKQNWPLVSRPEKQGLYDPALEHDACGVGFVAHIKGKRSHQILIDAEEVLRNMDHRGACGCEPNTGDGAGILTALPHEFLQRVVRKELGQELPPPGQFAAGVVFLPQDEVERAKCKDVVEQLIAAAAPATGRLAASANSHRDGRHWSIRPGLRAAHRAGCHRGRPGIVG